MPQLRHEQSFALQSEEHVGSTLCGHYAFDSVERRGPINAQHRVSVDVCRLFWEDAVTSMSKRACWLNVVLILISFVRCGQNRINVHVTPSVNVCL